MTTTPTALDTYLQRLPLILDKIEALRQLADDHFGNDPEAIHWDRVGVALNQLAAAIITLRKIMLPVNVIYG